MCLFTPYKLVTGIHEMTIRLEELEPFVLLHSKAGDVHYQFEAQDKAQVEFIFKMIHEAREKAIEGISELGYIPSNLICVSSDSI